MKTCIIVISFLLSLNGFASADMSFPIFKAHEDGSTKTISVNCTQQNEGVCIEYAVVSAIKNKQGESKDTLNTFSVLELDRLTVEIRKNYTWYNRTSMLYIGTAGGILCLAYCGNEPALQAVALPVGIAFDLVKAPFAIPYVIASELHHQAEVAKLNRLLKRMQKGKASRPVIVSSNRFSSLLSKFSN